MKICLFDGCTRNSFSHGYCQIHQYKRTDSKAIEARNKTVEPRSAIRPYKRTTSDKSELKTTKNSICFSWGFRSQSEMFKYVWETREHKCLFSGSNLDLVPKYQWGWMFMHILRKGSYPMFKYNPDNIVLGHPNFHLAADNFTEEERTKHPTWNFNFFFSMQEQKKQEYVLFLKSNQL
ncbi:MAG: hypothetical protein ACYC5G_04070 [Candidatus Doudnabacteria bacterium]